MEKEIYRLTELNRDNIITLLKSEGYDFLYLTDEKLIAVFEGEEFVKESLGHEERMKRGAVLSVNRDDTLLNLEAEFPELKICVMSEEYTRMKRQLKMVDREAVRHYLRFFGYNRICFEGNGEIIKELYQNAGAQKENDKQEKALCITEYLGTRDGKQSQGICYLGMRQFLFELEVFATFPAEIYGHLEHPEYFLSFAERFARIFKKTGWSIVFSEKTPFSKWIINKCDWVQYLDDLESSGCLCEKVIIVDNGNLEGVNRFYNKYKDGCWIVVRRLIVLFRTWIMESLCAYFKNKLEEKGVSLYLVNWNWALNHPLFPDDKITSVQIERRENYNLYKIREKKENYVQFLQKIYGKKYSPEYVDRVMDIPNKIELAAGKIRHEDFSSPYINVVNGKRRTSGASSKSRHSLYMLGGCVFFGYAVEDSETIASYLQRRINKTHQDWRVVNMGTWGGNIDQTYKTFYDLKFRKGDIVIVSYAGYMPLGSDFEKFDISTALKDEVMENKPYFNSIVHCNHSGYEKVADKLWTMLKDEIAEKDNDDSEVFYLMQSDDKESEEEKLYSSQASEYIAYVKQQTPEGWDTGVRGAIVMNCNPFTLGHQFLIRQSAKKVDHLYIFVVEEDKSFFPFKDRIELVKAGTKDIKNVVVVPSGKLIISSVTFPGYFLKDSPDSVGVDTSLDVDIFARYIAGPLGITKRFVGEEPIDIVTRNYNESMKEILPRYGIEVDEIKRKEESGGVISASRVRRALKAGNFEMIRCLVPDTTYQYLCENKEKFIDQ